MGNAGKRLAAWPALYGVLYPIMLDAAKGSGYALAIHGSLARDMDVIAVPWTEDAIPPEELVERVTRALMADWWVGAPGIHGDPTEHPHGRLVWTLLLDGNAFVDFGVMPRRHVTRDGKVHNHGPEEGPGLNCRESLIGDCLRASTGHTGEGT